jgi:hypothetical protein
MSKPKPRRIGKLPMRSVAWWYDQVFAPSKKKSPKPKK